MYRARRPSLLLLLLALLFLGQAAMAFCQGEDPGQRTTIQSKSTSRRPCHGHGFLLPRHDAKSIIPRGEKAKQAGGALRACLAQNSSEFSVFCDHLTIQLNRTEPAPRYGGHPCWLVLRRLII